MPACIETVVGIYFRTFEKIAEQSEWKENKLLSIFVCKLVGKAYKVYVSSDKESSYEVIKATILNAYSVAPDSYRQQFRNLKKEFDQTFTVFAHELKRLFKKWLEATEAKDFADLINLLVFEQFKSKLPFFVLRHIEEQREKNVAKAAGLADAQHLLVHLLSSAYGDFSQTCKIILICPI